MLFDPDLLLFRRASVFRTPGIVGGRPRLRVNRPVDARF
jgi:hypothetical protein